MNPRNVFFLGSKTATPNFGGEILGFIDLMFFFFNAFAPHQQQQIAAQNVVQNNRITRSSC